MLLRKLLLISSFLLLVSAINGCDDDDNSGNSENTDSITTTIPSSGGEAILDNIAKVSFSDSSFTNDTEVIISKTSNESTSTTFDEFATLFRAENRISYEVRINTGNMPPISETVDVTINLDADFIDSIPVGSQVEVFAQVLQNGGEETVDNFELFESTYNESSSTSLVELPTAVFTNTRTSDNSYEAILTIATTPGVTSARARLGNQVASRDGECLATNIICPLERGCDVTSPYAPARAHPITGEVRPHYGTDFRAPNGSILKAAADGKIERSYKSPSYGETIIIRHDDGGATLYAHLKNRDVNVGDVVKKGGVIGQSNNTGSSSGPHLHFEYVPNGQIIRSKHRIDPVPCINATATGSITVRDDGNAADDAFSVTLDDINIGSTSIGASNTIAVNNIIPGVHSLGIVATVAPDDIGTYEITLGDGITFTDGSTLVSGVLSQGAGVTFGINVPEPQ